MPHHASSPSFILKLEEIHEKLQIAFTPKSMKRILIPSIFAALVLPLSASDSDHHGDDYGGLDPGTRFKFTVEEIESSMISGEEDESKKAKIPKGLPKFKIGQQVRFKIGNKGHLITKGARIPFRTDGGVSNIYRRVTTGKKPKTDTATVSKDADGHASGVDLNFIRISGKALSMKTYSLSYTLR